MAGKIISPYYVLKDCHGLEYGSHDAESVYLVLNRYICSECHRKYPVRAVMMTYVELMVYILQTPCGQFFDVKIYDTMDDYLLEELENER